MLSFIAPVFLQAYFPFWDHVAHALQVSSNRTLGIGSHL
jgi:hypothetical protein